MKLNSLESTKRTISLEQLAKIRELRGGGSKAPKVPAQDVLESTGVWLAKKLVFSGRKETLSSTEEEKSMLVIRLQDELSSEVILVPSRSHVRTAAVTSLPH